MPKRFIKRFIPESHQIHEKKYMRFFARFLNDGNLWHLNRRSVATAFSIGLFAAFMPMPFQMLLATIFAIILRANLPLSVALVWISNPFTMAPMFYAAYKIGTWILFLPPQEHSLVLSWSAFSHEVALIWQPLLIGTLACGLISAIIGNIAIRIIWRVSVVRKWRARQNKSA